MHAIPCVLMRGGTSKGPFFLASDLPDNEDARDELLLQLMGSGNELEIDGIGGGYPQTSKVAIVGPSSTEGVDVDYLFVQVMVEQRRVDVSPNCGNMLSAVGPFAIEKGLVTPSGDTTCIRIRNVNTNTLIDATVQTPNGQVRYDGDAAIDGVPGTAAPIHLTFLNAVGARTGKLYPTGQSRDTFDGVEVSCVDAAMPMVLIHASALGKRGDETPAELDDDKAFMARLERIRRQAGLAMGFGDVSDKVIPKPVLISEGDAHAPLTVRYFMPHRCHRALAITGAVGLAIACSNGESLIRDLIDPKTLKGEMDIAHPSGRLSVAMTPDASGQAPICSLLRTARRLFSGDVFVPDAND